MRSVRWPPVQALPGSVVGPWAGVAARPRYDAAACPCLVSVKKKSPSGRRSPGRPAAPTPSRASQANAFRELVEHRRRLAEHRTALAADTAGAVVNALIAAARGWSDDNLEDDFCIRYAAALPAYDGSALNDMNNPEAS